MNKVFQGFQQFILRGNVIDLAVGVVIGAAFNSVVGAMVKDLLTPLIAVIVEVPNFSKLVFTIRNSQFSYGDFINNVVSFLLVALSVYFFVVLPMNAINDKIKNRRRPPDPTTKQCPECLSIIPISATRCAYCAQKIS